MFGLNPLLALEDGSLRPETCAPDGDLAIRGGSCLLLASMELAGNVGLGDLELLSSDEFQTLTIFFILGLRELLQWTFRQCSGNGSPQVGHSRADTSQKSQCIPQLARTHLTPWYSGLFSTMEGHSFVGSEKSSFSCARSMGPRFCVGLMERG